MPRIPFLWIDVFAREPLTGNPLALVPDADHLTATQMRAIAKEFNQSETTFLVTATLPGADHRLRSFTPGGAEVLGAGHNAMGAWIWLAAAGRLPTGRADFRQQIGDQVLPVHVESSSDDAVRVTMRQSPPRFLGRPERHDALEQALGLQKGGLRQDIPTQVVSTGAEHLLVPATSSAAVDAAVPAPADLEALLADAGAEGCYLFSLTPDRDDVAATTRFFNPTVGIAEDPATGTAAGPLAAFLVHHGLVSGPSLRIEQGRAIGRPSVLDVRVDGERVDLSGSGVVAAEGTLFL